MAYVTQIGTPLQKEIRAYAKVHNLSQYKVYEVLGLSIQYGENPFKVNGVPPESYAYGVMTWPSLVPYSTCTCQVCEDVNTEMKIWKKKKIQAKVEEASAQIFNTPTIHSTALGKFAAEHNMSPATVTKLLGITGAPMKPTFESLCALSSCACTTCDPSQARKQYWKSHFKHGYITVKVAQMLASYAKEHGLSVYEASLFFGFQYMYAAKDIVPFQQNYTWDSSTYQYLSRMSTCSCKICSEAGTKVIFGAYSQTPSYSGAIAASSNTYAIQQIYEPSNVASTYLPSTQALHYKPPGVKVVVKSPTNENVLHIEQAKINQGNKVSLELLVTEELFNALFHANLQGPLLGQTAHVLAEGEQILVAATKDDTSVCVSDSASLVQVRRPNPKKKVAKKPPVEKPSIDDFDF